ncbi:uncharacterized protein LOC133520823 [Cydia pomonella]|uniref:uncharacterized protein LOC133520823 n=1 Tax=Cydia pomonella TaxID=82600 RepID=UPI002ADD9A1C|nr:uncharacterized protein LOC133520823 [Cydia pomonella]
MASVFSVAVILVVFVNCVQFASAIFCYDCNSAFDPRCGEEFDPFSLGVVNCSLRDPPDHINVSEPSICRSIKMEIYGKVRVVRQCGYIEDDPNEKNCQRKAGNGDLFVTYCSCDTDLCNHAAKHGLAVVMMAMVLLILQMC